LHVLDVFTVQPVISPIQLAKLEQKKRKRASGNTSIPSKESSW